MNTITLVAATLVALASSAVHADPNDGPGDTPDRPDIWVDRVGDNNVMVTPGDNEPVAESREGNVISLDFDQAPSDNSEIVESEPKER